MDINKPFYFIYCDASGNITARTITEPSGSGNYIQGRCSLRNNSLRTFRVDRVVEFFNNEDEAIEKLNYHIKNKTLFPKPKNKSKSKSKSKSDYWMSICFTGFKKQDKERLAEIALKTNMDIKKSITINLNILCYGYNAGPVKLKKAREQGVMIMDEGQFISLLKDAELIK